MIVKQCCRQQYRQPASAVTRSPCFCRWPFCVPRPTFCKALPTNQNVIFSKNKPPRRSSQERKSCYNYNGRRHSHLGEMGVLLLAFDWIGDAHLISGVRASYFWRSIGFLTPNGKCTVVRWRHFTVMGHSFSIFQNFMVVHLHSGHYHDKCTLSRTNLSSEFCSRFFWCA